MELYRREVFNKLNPYRDISDVKERGISLFQR